MVTTTARALVLEAPRRMAVRHIEIPAVTPDDALLRVEASAYCGTDHENWSGAISRVLPLIPGHEAVGRIEAIGPGRLPAGGWRSATGWEWRPAGVRVVPAVRGGRPRGCANHGGTPTGPFRWPRLRGFGVATPRSSTSHRTASWWPSHRIFPPSLACMYNAVANGIRWGAVVPETKPGDVVAVLGPGVRGLSAAAAAKEAGASFVMVTGSGRRDAPRLRLAPGFGADLAVDVAVEDPVAALGEPLDAWPTWSSTSPPWPPPPSSKPSSWRPRMRRCASPASTATARCPGSARTASSSSSCGSSAHGAPTFPSSRAAVELLRRVATRSTRSHGAPPTWTTSPRSSRSWPGSRRGPAALRRPRRRRAGVRPAARHNH